MDAKTDQSAGRCPVMHTNRDWWPNQLSLQGLHQNSSLSDPMGEGFDYAKEFQSLDLNAVIKDLTEAEALLPTRSQRGATGRGRITKGGAQMALADLYLWRSSYMKLNEWAKVAE